MRRGYKAAGVPHTVACRDRIERSMADVGIRVSHTPRLTEFLKDKIAEGDPRARSGSSDRTTRSKLRRSASRVCRVKVTEIIRSLHRHLQAHVHRHAAMK